MATQVKFKKIISSDGEMQAVALDKITIDESNNIVLYSSEDDNIKEEAETPFSVLHYIKDGSNQSVIEGDVNNNTASGLFAHTEGQGIIANHKSQHVFGEYNIGDSNSSSTSERGDYVEIVGNGTSTSVRSNARTLDWNGNEVLAGSLTLGKGTADQVTITAAQLKMLLDLLTSSNIVGTGTVDNMTLKS